MSRSATLGLALVCALFAQSRPAYSESKVTVSQSCSTAFEKNLGVSEESWQAPSNIFSKSLPYAIPAAFGMLVTSQVFKHNLLGSSDYPVFSTAFTGTVGIDLLTTFVSHGIGTSNLPYLKKLLGGEMGFWKRAGTNIVLNTVLINLAWLSAGWDIGPLQLCGGFALCSVVYPTLQALKNKLYIELPLKKDWRLLSKLEEKYPDQINFLKKTAFDNASFSKKILPHQRELLLLTAFETALTSQPLEELISPNLLSQYPEVLTAPINKLQKIAEKLAQLPANKKSRKKSISLLTQQKKIRREVINHLIDLSSSLSQAAAGYDEIYQLLEFSQDFDSDFTLELHQLMRKRLRGLGSKIAISTAIDMSISIGFFGGVCLEELNHWVKTGEISYFLQRFLHIFD